MMFLWNLSHLIKDLPEIDLERVLALFYFFTFAVKYFRQNLYSFIGHWGKRQPTVNQPQVTQEFSRECVHTDGDKLGRGGLDTILRIAWFEGMTGNLRMDYIPFHRSRVRVICFGKDGVFARNAARVSARVALRLEMRIPQWTRSQG